MSQPLIESVSWRTVFATLVTMLFIIFLGYGLVFGFNNPSAGPPNDAGQSFITDTSGNVSIGGFVGAAIGDNPLEVTGSIEIGRTGGPLVDPKLRFHDSGITWYSLGIDLDDNKFKINQGADVGSSDQFVLLSSGDVGIGTAAPTQKLDVTGQIHATGDICTDLGGGICLSTVSGGGGGSTLWSGLLTSNIYSANTGFNVGIGTDGGAVPSKLTVEGGGVTIGTTPQIGQWNSRVPQSYNFAGPYGANVNGYLSLTIGQDGLPIFVTQTSSNQLRVAHCPDINCATLATISSIPVTAYNISMTIGSDGYPVIAHTSGAVGSLDITKCNDILCSSASTQVNVAGSFSIETTDIEIGADGNPMISFEESSVGLKLLDCDDLACNSAVGPTGDFVRNIDLNVSSAKAFYHDMAIGGDGRPVIAYDSNTGATRELWVAKCVDLTCTTPPTLTKIDGITSRQTGLYISMTIGGDGMPIIAYHCTQNCQFTDGFGNAGRLTIAKCSSHDCAPPNPVTITTHGDLMAGEPPSAAQDGFYTDIAIGADGLPIVSYYSGFSFAGLPAILKCGNQACNSGGESEAELAGVGASFTSNFPTTSLAIGSDGLPLLMYYDSTLGVMRMHCKNDRCLPMWTRR